MLLVPLLFLGHFAASEVSITFPDVSDANKIVSLHEFHRAFTLVERIANLGTQALIHLLDSEPNPIISPVDIFSCLDILNLGAAGETKKELRKIVDHGEHGNLLKSTINSLQGVTHASAVFFNRDIIPKASFVRDSLANYQTEIHNVDFAHDPTVTLAINRWVAQKTNGTIMDLLRERFDPNTKAVVVDALLFHGEWLHPFAPRLTSIGRFSVDEENFVEVPLMHADLHIPLIKRGRYTAIGLPYKDDDLSMYALLPRDPGKEALKQVLRSLSPGDLRSFALATATRSIKIVLPKFRHITRLSLKDPLISQGLETSFLPGVGNFTNFSENKVDDIFVSDLYHSVYFEVNEQETIASAASSAILTKSGRFEFVATRPFILLVADRNGLLLFAGAITRPRWTLWHRNRMNWDSSMRRQETGQTRKPNAKFFVRILPTLDFSSDSVIIESNSKVMHVKALQNSLGVQQGRKKPSYWRFAVDEIFWNKSQEEVYCSVGKDLVEALVDGISGTIVAYGQTGSGKSFTLSGLRHHFENRGLILRFLSSLCSERDGYKNRKTICISVSYVEFLKSNIKDLLHDKLVQNLKDIKKKEITEEADVWKLIFEAEVRKSYNDSAPYMGSHRGHSVFTVHVKTVSLTDSHPKPTYAKVHVVDMAGIDCLGNGPSIWRTPSDLGYSNLSKTFMEQLLLCVTERTNFLDSACSLKNSKLLDYLQDTLRPYCLIRFVGHVFGNDSNIPITLSVLRFGERLKGFRASKLERKVLDDDPLLTLKILQEEVKRLKLEIETNEMVADSPNYSSMSKEKLEQIRRCAENFLQGNLETLTLVSLGQIEVTLNVFRELYEKASQEKERAVKEAVMAAFEDVQSQIIPNRNFTETPNMQLKISRRRIGGQHDSQISQATPSRYSEPNLAGSRKPSTVNIRVRVPDKGDTSERSEESIDKILTRSLKKVRSRKLDSAIRPGAKSNAFPNRVVPGSKDFAPDKWPSKEEAWQTFCTEKRDLVRIYQEDIVKLEETARMSRRNYANAVCEVARHRDELEKVKKEWDNWKHIQHICDGNENDEQEFLERKKRTAKLYGNAIHKKEVELNCAVEHCHATLLDLRTSAEELSEAKRALKNEFQTFCADAYKIVPMPDECSSSDVSPEKSAENISQDETLNQTRMELYHQLQRKMMNYRDACDKKSKAGSQLSITKLSQMPKIKKKEWVTLF